MADALAPNSQPTQDVQSPTVNAFDPQGRPGNVPVQNVQHAIQLGWKIPSPEEVQNVKDEQEYGSGIGNALKAGALGAGRGATFGLSDQFLTGSGIVNPKTLENLKKYQGFSSGLGEIAGIGASLMYAPEAEALQPAMESLKAAQATGDAAQIANATRAVETARTALTTGDLANPISAVSKIGGQVAQGIAGPESLGIAKVLAHGADAALQGAAFGAGDSISEHALGDDQALNAEKLFSNVGYSALFGGALGGILGGAGELLGKEASKAQKLSEVQNITKDVNEFASERLNKVDPSDLSSFVKDAPINEEAKQSFFDGLQKQKPNAKEIIQAAKDLDAPVLESQISDSKHVQDLDSMLSQSPTPVGVARQNIFKKGFDKATNAITETVSGGSDLSLAETGQKLISSVTEKFEAERKPIEELYNDLKKHYSSLDISENASKQIANNILKMEDVVLSPSSPEAQLARRVSEEIGNIKNLDDVKRYRSILRRNSGPETRYIVGQIDEKLGRLEESTLARYADEYSKAIPGVHDEVLNLFNQRKGANAMYATMRERMAQFGDVLGKRKIYGPQDFLDFINDVTPEKFAKKLFAKENSNFLKFMNENFKEETDLLMQYKRSELMNKALKDGRVQPGVVLREVNKLSPELKKIMFSAEDLHKINAAEVYLDAMPKNLNPSGTSKSEAYRRFFEHPLAQILQTGKDALTLGAITRSTPKEMRALFETQNPKLGGIFSAIQSTGQEVEKLTKAIFKNNDSGTVAGYAGSKLSPKNEKTKEPNHKDISEWANNPEKLMDHLNKRTQNLYDAAPNHATFLQSTAMKGVQFLNSKVPRAQKVNPLSPKYIPSKQETQEFNQYYKLVQNPLYALEQVRFGTLTPKTIETLQAVTPKLYQDMQQNIFMHLADHLKNGLLVPQKTKQALSLFLQQDLDQSTTTEAIAANQNAFSRIDLEKQNEQNQASNSQPMRPTQKGMANLKVSNQYLTDRQKSSQRIEG